MLYNLQIDALISVCSESKFVQRRVSEYVMNILRCTNSWVIFTAKTSLDAFSLGQEHGWVIISVMKRVTESGQQGMKT